MSLITDERPPEGTDPHLSEYLSRMFRDARLSDDQSAQIPKMTMLPDNLSVGKIYYFENAISGTDIDAAGYWGYTSEGWERLNGSQYVYNETLTVAAQTITISNLDGAADGGYEIEVLPYNNSGSACQYSMYINGDTTASNYRSLWVDFGSSHSTTNQGLISDGYICYSTSNRETTYAHIDLNLIYNTNDTKYDIRGIVKENRRSGTNLTSAFTNWFCNDANAANVTSITFSASVASGFGIGSIIRIKRKL